jgi:hypothetical protein
LARISEIILVSILDRLIANCYNLWMIAKGYRA